MFEISVICLCITAFLAYINHRWIGLPGTIGVMSIAMVISLAIVGMHQAGLGEISVTDLMSVADAAFRNERNMANEQAKVTKQKLMQLMCEA